MSEDTRARTFVVGAPPVRFRKATTETWEGYNPVLREGEPAYDKTAKTIKVGDGVTPWNELPPIGGGGGGGDPETEFLELFVGNRQPSRIHKDATDLFVSDSAGLFSLDEIEGFGSVYTVKFAGVYTATLEGRVQGDGNAPGDAIYRFSADAGNFDFGSFTITTIEEFVEESSADLQLFSSSPTVVVLYEGDLLVLASDRGADAADLQFWDMDLYLQPLLLLAYEPPVSG